MNMMSLLFYFIGILLILMTAMLPMAFYTLVERKFLGYTQFRKGPNKPSFLGLLVPISDAGKLFSKENYNGSLMNLTMFFLAPMTLMILAMLLWILYPNSNSIFIMKMGLFFFLCITSLSIYATFIAGWASSSKWGMLGALRGVAQTISYEVSLALVLITLMMYLNSMSTKELFSMYYSWIGLCVTPMMLMWLMSIIAETHRAPFDFAEGESELISGFNIEYKSAPFAFIFMAEYMNILFMSFMTVLLLSSNLSMFDLSLKTSLLSLLMIWVRSTFPRLRYDILMTILWKKILPVTLLIMILSMLMVS